MPTLCFGGWSRLGVPCRGALLVRVEQEEEKQVRTDIQNAREYLEGGNQVSLKSSPLQGMKAQTLQSLFVGEMPTETDHANIQPLARQSA